jgi:hypothetical protein
MKIKVTYITGCVPSLPWWDALNMTDEEIKTYNDKFRKYETQEFDDEQSAAAPVS